MRNGFFPGGASAGSLSFSIRAMWWYQGICARSSCTIARSGHAAAKATSEYAIKTINPDILIPIHTQNPEEFKKIHGDVSDCEAGGEDRDSRGLTLA